MKFPDGKRVAIVDDDPLFLEQICAQLQAEGKLRPVKAGNREELFEALKSQNVACIVLDYELGGENGFTVGQAVQSAIPQAPPMVMLTGRGSEQTAAKAFRVGFSDYLPKRTLGKGSLSSVIRGAITRHEEKLALAQETERLRKQQRLDAYTSLYSSAYVEARLNELCNSRSENGFTLFSVEIEKFEELQAQFGHSACERFFREFAHNLSQLDLGMGYFGHHGTQDIVAIFESRLSSTQIREVSAQLNERGVHVANSTSGNVTLKPIIGSCVFPDEAQSSVALVAAAKSNPVGAMPEHVAGSERTDSDVGLANKAVAGSDVEIVDRRSGDEGAAGPGERRSEQRRREQRFRVLKRGRIIVDAVGITIDCKVRNISASGAHIQFDSYFRPPDRFKLEIMGSGEVRSAVVRWQAGADLGIEYVENEDGL